MSYLVLARKWRPRNFAEMVGQEHVVRALTNALTSGRVHHAFLFTGTRGVGKTTVARILAKSLNCETGVTATPCGECAACREIDAGRFVDLLEVDAASRTKVDQTRELLDNVQYAPTRGRYKVYLIDEVHMLSDHSFNALLKTLEEPPPHVKFLLATTDPQKLPITVVSRCLQFHLKRLSPPLIVERLRHILEAEQVSFAVPALPLIARAADGSLRDALSLLDQLLVFGAGQVTEADTRSMLGTIDRGHVIRIAGHVATGDAGAAITEVAAMEEHAPDYDQVLLEFATLLQRVALQQLVTAAPEDDSFDAGAVADLAAKFAPQDVQLCYQMALVGRRDLALAPDPRSGFEMTLLRMIAFRPASASGASPEAPRARASAAPAAAAPTRAQPAAPAVIASVTPGGDWQSLVAQLEVSGAARQLAQNCALLGREGAVVRLRLDRRSTALRTPATEERLQQALAKLFGTDIRLTIDIDSSETGMSDTPARRQERDQQDRLEATRTALENDPAVRALKDRFGATIEPQSVKPLN